MGEKYTQIIYGAFTDDIQGECPDEDGWFEWADSHDAFQRAKKGYGKALHGATLTTSYESEPSWVGFAIQVLDYGETWEVQDLVSMDAEDAPAVKAWKQFQKLAAEVGATLPDGRLIIAHDE